MSRIRAAVLGSPIEHSLSPVLHRAAYRELGLADWTYDRFEIDEAALAGFLAGLGPEWAGLSLTMPLKRAVIPLLDAVNDTAASVEAVNTVVFTEDGRRLGDNTDIPGIVAALHEQGVDKVPAAAILGAGCHRLLRAGRTRTDLHRRGHRVRALPRPGGRDAAVGRAARCRGPHGRLVAGGRGTGRPLVIATTPVSATDELAPAVPAAPGTLFDVLYDPWPTALAAVWSARGGALVGGLDLLVHQAVLQVEQMTGRAPGPLAAMRAAGERALAAR